MATSSPNLLKAGDSLGPYRIESLLGKGGMGEVYRARDPRLGREVAIKVSAERFSERFEREARAIAALNHPNICQIYDVGPNYLVMELVEGESPKGPLPLETALPYARQIAEALATAHDKGIVHRDLKPANIKITPAGAVKVLDFGLAKISSPEPESTTENSPTLTMQATRAGVVLGTAAYMSPEQARGKLVDKRADIWAFGVVLYEMLAGKRLFQGEDLTETLASVVKEEPKLDQTPFQVRRLLKKCLQKDPARRLRDISDVWDLLDEGPPFAAAGQISSARGWAPWILALALLVALASLAFIHFRESKPPVLTATFQIPPDKLIFNIGTNANLSPDGRWLAFPAVGPDNVSRMWLRALDSLEVRTLEGAETSALTPAPFWSPDSRFIAYVANGKLKKQAIAGGPPETLADSTAPAAAGGAWNRDGVIVWGSNNGALERTLASGGTTIPVTIFAAGETAHRFPQFLPDGHHFIYQRTGKPETTGMYVGSIDVKPEAQPLKPLFLSDRQAEYAPSRDGGPGWLLFIREGALMAQRFDPDRLALSGDPVQAAAAVSAFATVNIALYSVSENDELVYRSGSSAGQSQLIWTDAQGKAAGTLGDPGQYYWPELSPDGARIAVGMAGAQGNTDIWVLDIAHGGASRRLTFDPAVDTNPVWSPDGKQIVFASVRGGHLDLYVHAADGSGEDQLLLKSDENKTPTGFSRDGRYLLYTSTNPKTHGDIWVLPMFSEQAGGERKPFPFLRTEFNEAYAQFSPDGHWIAYMSNESGMPEVYVRPFAPGVEASGGKSMLSKGGGSFPRWRGTQLIYMTYDGRVSSLDVTTRKIVEYGVPKVLFQSPAPASNQAGAGDISADGKRFLFAAQAGATAPAPFTVVLNWQAGLKK